MKRFFRLTAAILVCAMLCAATSCYSAPPTVIDPVDDTVTTTTMSAEGSEAGPIQMLSEHLLGMRGETITWSMLEGYIHTKTDNAAHFDVADDNGVMYSLDVIISPDGDILAEAVATYNDASVDILTCSFGELVRFFRTISNGDN